MSEIHLTELRRAGLNQSAATPDASVSLHDRPRDRAAALSHGKTVRVIEPDSGGGAMAKRFGRPSAQYRYEHYDPR